MPRQILLCTENPSAGQRLAETLRAHGFSVRMAASAAETEQMLSRHPFSVCVVDGPHAVETAETLCATRQSSRRTVPLVCLVAEGELENTTAKPSGEFEVLERSIGHRGWITVLRLLIGHSELITENKRLKHMLNLQMDQDLPGFSAAMCELKQKIHEVAAAETPVLIEGEAGTETNVVARCVHQLSRRSSRPFMSVDCAALTGKSFERELLGNGSDAFLSVNGCAVGRLEQADSGTLFLDNIDALTLPMQVKLVRALQKGRFDGAAFPRSFDLRVIAASNADLASYAKASLFRSELYEVLSCCRIHLPELRNRRQDIAPLAERFLTRTTIREGRPMKRLTLEALELLRDHDWPGNVRELQNVIDRACSLDLTPKLTAESIRPWLCEPTGSTESMSPGMTLKEMERKLIETTFARCAGNRERTAQALKIGLRTLCGKLREYGYPPRGGPGSNHSSIRARAA